MTMRFRQKKPTPKSGVSLQNLNRLPCYLGGIVKLGQHVAAPSWRMDGFLPTYKKTPLARHRYTIHKPVATRR